MRTIKRQISVFLVALIIISFSSISPAFSATEIGEDISTSGDLTVDGTVKFTSGAILNYILKSDSDGVANWTSIGSALINANSDNLPEGSTNQYYTDTKVDQRIDLQKGTPNGLATLDGSGQIPAGQIPSFAINQTYVFANISDRDLASVDTGDVAIVLDAGLGASRSYIFDGAVWVELLTPLQLYLSKSNNLSDLSNIAVARTNIGLGTGNSPVFSALTLSNLTNDAQIPKSIGLAKGDLIGFSASGTPARLPAGAINGYVLTFDNTTTTGLKWAENIVSPNSLDFSEFKNSMTVDENTTINLSDKTLTITGQASGGALNITSGASSTWSTSTGSLTIDSGATLNLGTTNSSSQINHGE